MLSLPLMKELTPLLVVPFVTSKPHGSPTQHTYNHIKSKSKSYITSTIAHNLATCYENDSRGSVHYVRVSHDSSVSYGKKSAACSYAPQVVVQVLLGG